MEVRGQNSDFAKPAQQRFQELRDELTRRDAARVRQARETLAELSERRQEIQEAAREEAARRAELVKDAQESVRKTDSKPAARPKGDSIEISDAAREAVEVAAQSVDDPARAERVEELRAAFAAGELNTPDRIAQAAQRLLGAD